MPPHESSFVFALKNLTLEGQVTFGILSLLSLVAWTVIVGKVLALRKQQKKADLFYDRFGETTDPLELVGLDDEFDGAPPYSVYDYGIRELQRLQREVRDRRAHERLGPPACRARSSRGSARRSSAGWARSPAGFRAGWWCSPCASPAARSSA